MSHMQPNTRILIYLYRKGNGIIPSFTRVYGAAQITMVTRENFSSFAKFEIKRSEIIALDKLSQRCDSSKDEQSVSKCVEERFVEKDLNCSLRRLMSNPMLSICNDPKLGTYNEGYFYGRFNWLYTLDEREIYEITGCTPSCSKSKFEIVTRYQDNMLDDSKNVAEFRFVYPRGEYDLREEYYIYNWGSFIADVGGYLGLLLGSSALSMYHIITPLLIKQMRRLAKKTTMGNTNS